MNYSSTLRNENDRHDRGNNWPVTGGMRKSAQASSGVGVVRVGDVIRKGSVDQDGARAVNVSDRDDRLVEVLVVAGPDQFVEQRGILGVVAATIVVGVATARNRLGLVLARRLVVEGIRPGIVVHICTVKPNTRPEGKRSASKKSKGH